MVGHQALNLLMVVRVNHSEYWCGLSIDSDVRLVTSEERGANPRGHPNKVLIYLY